MAVNPTEPVSIYRYEFDLIGTVCDHAAKFCPVFSKTVKKHIGVLLISQKINVAP